MNPWTALKDVIGGVLTFFNGAFEPIFGDHSWGWAIIALTVAVRVVLLPLAIKQTRSQRAMQALQPQMKKIQEKYKADKGLMRSDPEKYRELRAKQQEAMMGLYKEHGVNPASGCLPLLLQMPVFFALFQVLQQNDALRGAPFLIWSDLAGSVPKVEPVGSGLVLVVLMAATTYYSSRQMMASTPASGQAAQQQKIMMYAMPVMLAVFSWNMYIGVLVYWVTTNIWTIGQQYVMFRSVTPAAPAAGTAKTAKATPPKATKAPPKSESTAGKKPKKATE